MKSFAFATTLSLLAATTASAASIVDFGGKVVDDNPVSFSLVEDGREDFEFTVTVTFDNNDDIGLITGIDNRRPAISPGVPALSPGLYFALSFLSDGAGAALARTTAFDFLSPGHIWSSDVLNLYRVAAADGSVTGALAPTGSVDIPFRLETYTLATGVCLGIGECDGITPPVPDYGTPSITYGFLNLTRGSVIVNSATILDDTAPAVPLPAGLPLMLAGLGGFALLRRKA